MKNHIYAIIFVLLIGIFIPKISYARTYINPSGATDDFDDEDEDDEDDDESGPGADIGPGTDIGPGPIPYTSDFEKIAGRNYWVGWRKYHYNFTATPTARKGEDVNYTYQIINTVTGATDIKTGSATAKGYGLYSMDYNKHMLGLLYYMSRYIGSDDYLSSYVPTDVLEFNADGTPIEPEQKVMSVACKEVADRIVETFYSSDYEEGKFKEFWEGSFTGDKEQVLGKLQSAFFCNAYAKNAISKLEHMGFPIDEVNTNSEKAAIYGMIFSIMEARYRNKNLQGKSNLQLKVAEGDLWPFLVYCNNISSKKVGSTYSYTYDWPSLDTIVDGVYQWMYYYESEFETSTSASTFTSAILQNEVDDEADEADWEAEYLELTNEDDFPYLSGQSLQDFYNRISIVRSTFKKSTENAHGTFGAEEIYDITSEVSYTTAMNDMKDAMRNFVADTDLSNVWSGLTSENIARTYMMAKNIVENERVQSEYAYYNIGTNVINSTPGLEGSEYILVDFERIKLKEPLYKKDKQGKDTIPTYEDTDGDGLYDRDELGNDGKSSEFYDITEFIKKMVLAELYGSNYKIVTEERKRAYYFDEDGNPKEHPNSSLVYLTESEVSNIMAGFKKNLIQRRLDGQITDGSGDSVLNTENKIDRHEQAEYYLNCFTSSDTDGTHYADITNAESSNIKVKLYSFKSNPIFKDTDFDGVMDGKGVEEFNKLKTKYGVDKNGKIKSSNIYNELKNDQDPQNNVINGTMNTNNFFNVSASSHMDYRYFFMNNKNYYDELSTMSLLLCNTLERHNALAGTGDLSDITMLFRKIGLKKWDETDDVLIKTATYGTNGKVEYVVGENEIEYAHNYDETVISKKVKLIAIKSIDAGFDNIEKIGKNERNNAYSQNNHELFDGLAQDIYKKEFKGKEFCYWITGYNTGGAVANILAAMMIDNGLVFTPKGGIASNSNLSYYVYDNGQLSPQSVHERVISNVYAYTFGAPYTVYNGDDAKNQVNSIQSKYASIFNVVSNNDIYPFIHTNNYKWGRYGVSCYKRDGKENFIENAIHTFIDSFDEMPSKYKRQEILNALNGIFSPVREVFDFDNKVNYRTEYYKNKQEEILKDILKQIMNGSSNIAINIKIDNPVLYGKYLLFTNKLNNNNLRTALKSGKDEKVYYDLSKKILPEDLTFVVNSDEEFRITNKVKDGIDYDRFPCYQTIGTPININNEIPIMFQTKECWSEFRYGTKYNEEDDWEHKDEEGNVLYKGKRYDATSGYSYGNFHESSCACCSLAMAISFERKETITPVDVRNMWEENTDSYRTNTNLGTDHKALNIACERFGLTNLAFRERTTNTAISYNSDDGSFTVSKKNAYALIDYLIKGHPIIAHCGTGEFTVGNGHFIVMSGINSDDVKKFTKEDGTIDSKNYEKIRIYVSDPAEYHKNQKNEYKLDTFTNTKNTDKFWVFDGTSRGDISFENGKFNYMNNNQSEWFKYQKETTFKEHKMKSKTWEDPK